jgi:DNA-directed RNA polymerase subunit RPC12/RpoP
MCPKCGSENVFKRITTNIPNNHYTIGNSKQPMSYRRKKYQCLKCWHEYDIE